MRTVSLAGTPFKAREIFLAIGVGSMLFAAACGDANSQSTAEDGGSTGMATAGSGTGGSAATGGSTGNSGTTATSGSSVAAADGGPSSGAATGGAGGTTGTSATSGATGTSGTTGTSGAAGTSGTSGTGGSSGTTGTASGDGGSVTVAGCSSPAPAGSPVALHGQLRVVGTGVQDQLGNPVQLKGISSFWLNWEGQPDAESKVGLQSMRDNWKISVLRAAMGVDVSAGYLTNQAAMQAKIDAIMTNALALGVYVIVDWHTGDAPSNQAQAVTFFKGLATKYGSCPNILYEDFNEPVNLTWAQIKPYHQAIVAAIRPIDPDNLIIMGTPTFSQDVDLAALDPVAGTNLLYTLHWYSCSHTQWLRTKGDTAISKGLALFVTEFGATPANGGVAPQNTICEAEADLWFAWMAQNGISGAAWKLARGTDSSNILVKGAASGGPWTDSDLTQTTAASPGHGQIIVDWIRQSP